MIATVVDLVARACEVTELHFKIIICEVLRCALTGPAWTFNSLGIQNKVQIFMTCSSLEFSDFK